VICKSVLMIAEFYKALLTLLHQPLVVPATTDDQMETRLYMVGLLYKTVNVWIKHVEHHPGCQRFSPLASLHPRVSLVPRVVKYFIFNKNLVLHLLNVVYNNSYNTSNNQYSLTNTICIVYYKNSLNIIQIKLIHVKYFIYYEMYYKS
jgi:hypothetical protein